MEASRSAPWPTLGVLPDYYDLRLAFRPANFPSRGFYAVLSSPMSCCSLRFPLGVVSRLDLILPPYFPQRRLARLQPGHVQVLRSGNGGGVQVDWKAYLP